MLFKFVLFYLIYGSNIELSCQSVSSELFEIRPYSGEFGSGVCEGSTLTWKTYNDASCDSEYLISTDSYPLDHSICMQSSAATQIDHRFFDFLRNLVGFFGCNSTDSNLLRYNKLDPCINDCKDKENNFECLELSSEKITGSCVNEPNTTEAKSADRECKFRHLITSYLPEYDCGGNWTSRTYLWWKENELYTYPGTKEATVWQFNCDENGIFSQASQDALWTKTASVNQFSDLRIFPKCLTSLNVSWRGLTCFDAMFTILQYPQGCSGGPNPDPIYITANGGCNNQLRTKKLGISEYYRAWCVDDRTVRMQPCFDYDPNSASEQMPTIPEDKPTLLDPYSPIWFIFMMSMFGIIFLVLAMLVLKLCTSYKDFILDSDIKTDEVYSEMDAQSASLWDPSGHSLN